jgi:uncharacterized protein (TIGR02594 family)
MMSPLPIEFEFLESEPVPDMLKESLKWYGMEDDRANNRSSWIMGWSTELKLESHVTIESAWDGLFMAICAKRAGNPLPHSPLIASDWLTWGQIVDVPVLGDLLICNAIEVNARVGLYVGETNDQYYVLLGDYSGVVGIKMFPKHRLLGARNCYVNGLPDCCRQVFIS